MIVMKFGGTSVEDARSMKSAKEFVHHVRKATTDAATAPEEPTR